MHAPAPAAPVSREAIDGFLAQRTLAVVGASRTGRGFGNAAYRELRGHGYQVYAVHPAAERIEGDRVWPSLDSLPGPVGGVFVSVPPAETVRVVEAAAQAGIRRVWMQWGAESPEALALCEARGIEVVHGHCILMFAEPCSGIHRAHRWLWGALRKVPA